MKAIAVDLDGQYRALREGAGVAIRDRRRIFSVEGGEAPDYLQGQLTNDVEAIGPGEGCYAALLDRKGHLQGDLRALRLSEHAYSLDTEDVAGDRVLRHLTTYKVGRQVEVAERSAELVLVSVIGPAAEEVLGFGPLAPEHAHREHEVAMGSAWRAVATDLGIDLIGDRAAAPALTERLIGAGAEEVSEEAIEIVRVESGRPRFGHDMSERTMPAEAGITERAVSFTKGCYIGQETVARLHYRGKPNRHLRGLRLDAPAAVGDPVLLGDRELGTIGTAVLSPAHGPIALAVLRREAEPGVTVTAGEGIEAGVVELPFG